ncbi:CHAD domain-containing protein [Nocardia bovistercoris]|uniref:CHAD domain-containing protein n=1 Tax=Nocardia bovistercoris TaxID=2785916 RepID=A0A931IIQ9_9NOCA|nr:CHAD domain-containing protein [Nocardia bovistercoris]MBH0781081.1 CHAD domain-containing protein [Nocardia bovistercoris]
MSAPTDVPPRTANGAEVRKSNAEALADYLSAQRDAIVDAEVAARGGDAAAIPAIIIAARRARSALAAHRVARDRHRHLRRLIEELRWFGLALGAAHDLDVQATRLRASLGALRARYVRGEVAEHIDRYFDHRIDQARIEGRALLGSRRRLAVVTDLDSEIAALRGGEANWPVTDRPGVLLDELVERVEDRMRAVAVARGEDARDAAVHSVRKAVRRTRYYIESLGGAESERGAALVALESLQNMLGEHHDAVVAKQHLLQLVDEADKAGAESFTYGLLYQRELDIADRRAESLPRVCREAMDAVRTLAALDRDRASSGTRP